MTNWTLAHKKLPDTFNEFNESESVLIFYKGVIEVGYYNSDDGWWRNDAGHVLYNIVTHWMKLPEKPKQR